MPVMKKSKYRGMSMSTRMLLFSSLFLLALPWLGYRYIDEMKDFLLQGQEDAQLLAARAVATVLHGRTELFYLVEEPTDIALEKNALYVYPLEEPIEVDGYTGDWGELQTQAKNFGGESVIYHRTGGAGQAHSFSLLLGEYGKYIYALVRVMDENIIYRNPKYRRLDHSDHVRLELINQEGDKKHIMFITEGQGQVSVYEMESDWRIPVTGQPLYALSGIWRELADGYYLELRLPVSWLGPQQQMMISVANVDSTIERKVDSIVATLQKDHASKLNLLITRSPQLDRILQGLGSSDAAICVVDRYRRVRGVFGGDAENALCSHKDIVSGELTDAALEGDQSVLRYQNVAGESVIVASHPVFDNDEVLGAVLVEKNSSHILGLQRESLLHVITATFIVFLVAIFGLMLFAAWLAYRIRKLQKEASCAIDADGRVITEHLTTDQYAADEIGQLSRDFSSLLSRLKSYTGFLESVPRTLRHEILNPVNTISMSLQKLEVDKSNESILNSASKATQQLEMIVHGLTEAAHIDEALTQDEYESFDLAAMTYEYVANSKLKHGGSRFKYLGPDSGVYIRGSDLRIAQLLDKLKDNALDFSADNSEVLIELKRKEGVVELSVENNGPVIAEDVLDALFAGIISNRPAKNDKPHLGIGLYIANRIAQQHQGELKIMNLGNSEGVRVSLFLPVTD
jgi:two-component system sensor histidine kinase ChvG